MYNVQLFLHFKMGIKRYLSQKDGEKSEGEGEGLYNILC